jgi:hypothetical protein
MYGATSEAIRQSTQMPFRVALFALCTYSASLTASSLSKLNHRIVLRSCLSAQRQLREGTVSR